ncbi:MAG: HD-GYP domain-containing protein [Caulobacteraceae bacterium]
MSIGVATTMKGKKESIYDVYQRADDNMYKYKLSQVKSPRSKVIDMLLLALSEKDFIAYGHVERLSKMAGMIADRIHLSDMEKEDLILLAKMHDLGKVGIPDEILFKPSKLSKEEYEKMKNHVYIGYKIANRSKDLSHISNLILHHHENWDGSGYPDGLKGDQIPILCRMVSIIDAYDAMTSDRPYRKAMTREEAISELKRCSGSQFDPDLVKEFLRIIG